MITFETQKDFEKAVMEIVVRKLEAQVYKTEDRLWINGENYYIPDVSGIDFYEKDA